MVRLLGIFGLVVSLAATPSRADRAGVEWALDQMRTAVLAADVDAYLTNVSADDAIFLKEQQNWAKDLRLHVPSDFRLSIHEPDAADPPASPQGDSGPEEGAAAEPVFDDEIGQARFEMVMEWTMSGLGRNGADVKRTVSFPVIFRRDGDGRWLYCGEDWRTVESGGQAATAKPPEPGVAVSDAPNRARYFPGFEEVARRVVEVLPEVRAHVDEGFQNPVRHVQEVKIYPSMRHLQASIYLSYVDGLGGWNEPGESIKLLASGKTTVGHLRSLLGHEYGHVATFELGPHATDMPWWVLEGVAELSAEKFVAMNAGKADQPDAYGRSATIAVESWARKGKLAAWPDLADFRNIRKELTGQVYKQGQHMLGYISQRFGRTARNAWLRALSQGDTLDQASRKALGIGFDDLDRDWRATLPSREDEAPAPELKP